ncbi:MAG: hypothetical protein Q9207_002576 [Kuettlingeria erythrocarpa]
MKWADEEGPDKEIQEYRDRNPETRAPFPSDACSFYVVTATPSFTSTASLRELARPYSTAPWLTVELGLTREDSDQQVLVHERLPSKLGGGFDAARDHGRRDHGVHRRLCHSALNPTLETIFTKAGIANTTPEDCDAYRTSYPDYAEDDDDSVSLKIVAEEITCLYTTLLGQR